MFHFRDPKLDNPSTAVGAPTETRQAFFVTTGLMHLLFDVYIEDAPLGIHLRGDRKRFDEEKRIRTSASSYKYRTKFDITRYTLISYSKIDWESATIRIECQNKQHESIYEEVSRYFPGAQIQRHRSDSAKKYVAALDSMELEDNPWIFFSPNNDHPLVSNEEQLKIVLKDAEAAEERTSAQVVSVPYSHHTECMNFLSPFHHNWGAYGGVYPRLLYETETSYVIKLNKLLIDSLHVYRYHTLASIFGNTKNSGRVIRLEDTELYLTDTKDHVMVVPKIELCRHYDGYMNLTDKVPPLFIPKGYPFSSTRPLSERKA